MREEQDFRINFPTYKIYEDKTIKEGFLEFLNFLEYKNDSEATKKDYKNNFRMFCEIVDENTLCKNITMTTFYYYVNEKKKRNSNIKDVTIATYIRHLRAIFYFFMERGYMEKFKIQIPHYVIITKPPHTNKEIELLLLKPNIEKTTFAMYRNWVMACTFAGTGIRRATICAIKTSQVNFNDMIFYLTTTKNKVENNIPIANNLAIILKEYLAYLKSKGINSDYLFCKENGEKLKVEGVKSAIRRYSIKRKVESKGTHKYRNTFAKNFIINGGKLNELQTILGHSTLTMSNHYAKLFGTDLKDTFSKRNILDLRPEIIYGLSPTTTIIN